MQFLEYSQGQLRSPILHFEEIGHAVVFDLYPTIHIGTPEYYQAVMDHLGDCDRVLYEYFETFSLGPRDHDDYRNLARRLGLVSQLDAIDYECVPATWTLADFTPGTWEHAVAQLPSWQERLMFTARGQALIARLNALLPAPTREALALMCDMSQTMHEELVAQTPLDTMIMDDRNRILINALKRFSEIQLTDASSPFVVGVFYGAAHMPAIVEYLTDRLGFLCRSAEWIDPPVFTW
jgi:hypothetical protein